MHLIACLLLTACAACNGSDSKPLAESGTDEMFSRQKSNTTENFIHADVAATLQESDSFPQAAAAANGGGMTCRKVRIEGSGAGATFVDDADAQTPDTGYIISGMTGRPPVAILNNADFRFETWNLAADDRQTVSTQQAFANIHPQQDSWVGFYALDVACMPGNRALVAVAYYNPRVSYALYLYDIAAASFRHLVDVEPDIQDPYRFFEVRRPAADTALVLYYSDRTRKAAELYHNYYHHILLFSPRYADGIEVLRLGIDTGNVTDWTVSDGTLYLRTLDGRDAANPKRGSWSLDLSRVLGQ